MRKIVVAVAVLSSVTVLSTSCAPKRVYAPNPVPAWDVIETMVLEAPEDLSERQQSDFREGWRALRAGDLERSASSLEPLGLRYPRSTTIASALGLLELRLGDPGSAAARFESALREDPLFGPAQGGYFLVALAAGDEEVAFDRLRRLQKNFPQHELVDRYETTLQLNVAESRLRRARELAAAGSFGDAADAYLRVLEVAPEAGALYLETAEVELDAGIPERAAIHARRASELEPDNAEAFRVLAEAAYASGDLRNAVDAFRSALSIRTDDRELSARYDVVRAEFSHQNVPEEYLSIRDARRLTREQLAALVYLELRRGFDNVPGRQSVIATDISDSWASEFIRRVVGAGVLEVFPNHTFQPKAFVNRVELAETLSRALAVLAPENYELARRSAGTDVEFPDVARENLNHGAAALAVSLGLLDRGDEGAFEPQRFVTGDDAAHAVQVLSAHVAP